MSRVPEAIAIEVQRRARSRCEYCGVPDALFFRHEIDHIVAVQHRGPTEPDNLALACFDCNRLKGPNLSSVDPDSGEVVRLFDPRRDHWDDHFEIRELRIVGRTPRGRATVELLGFNSALRVKAREEFAKALMQRAQ